MTTMNKLAAVINTCFSPDLLVKPEDRLSAYGVDSMQFLEFILMIEDDFDIDLGVYVDQISTESTVAEVASYIEAEIEKVENGNTHSTTTVG